MKDNEIVSHCHFECSLNLIEYNEMMTGLGVGLSQVRQFVFDLGKSKSPQFVLFILFILSTLKRSVIGTSMRGEISLFKRSLTASRRFEMTKNKIFAPDSKFDYIIIE